MDLSPRPDLPDMLAKSVSQQESKVRRQSIVFINGTAPTRRQTNLRYAHSLQIAMPKASLRLPPYILQNPFLKLLSEPHASLQAGQQIYQIIKDYAFFKKFIEGSSLHNDEESFYALCSKMQLEVFMKGQVIFKEGSESNDKMYVIAVGKVAVAMRNFFNISQFSSQKEENEENKKSQVLASASTPNLKFVRQTTITNSEINDINIIVAKYGQKINELGVGQQFGEKALLAESQKQAVRSATCIAMVDCYLITLKRDDFLDVIKQFKRDFQVKKTLLDNSIPKFDQIASQQIIENLMYSFKEEIHQKDFYLTKEKQTSEDIFILEQGEVAIMKMFKKHPVQVATVDDHNQGLIGEEALFSQDGTHEYTCVVVSQSAKVLKISQSSFKLKSPAFCVEGIKQIFQQKAKFREVIYKRILAYHVKNDPQLLEESSRQKAALEQEYKSMSTQFLFKSQCQTNQDTLRELLIKKMLQSRGLKSADPRGQKRVKTMIEESDLYKTSLLIQEVMKNQDVLFGHPSDTEKLKNDLIQSNYIDSFKVTIKKEKNLTEPNEDIATIAMGSKFFQNQFQGAQLSHADTDIYIFPESLKREQQFRLLQQGIIDAPKQIHKAPNIDRIISALKSTCQKKSQKFSKKQKGFHHIGKSIEVSHKDNTLNTIASAQILDLRSRIDQYSQSNLEDSPTRIRNRLTGGKKWRSQYSGTQRPQTNQTDSIQNLRIETVATPTMDERPVERVKTTRMMRRFRKSIDIQDSAKIKKPYPSFFTTGLKLFTNV